MLIAVIILSACLLLSLLLNIKGAVVLLEFNEKHEELADQVEQSLDILDDSYQRISKALETPVVSDDPIVRGLLIDIQHAKDAVLLVANKVVKFDQVDDDETKKT